MSVSKRSPSSLATPIALALGLQFASGWKSVKDIDNANKKLVKRFTKRVRSKLAISRFMDYPFPNSLLNNLFLLNYFNYLKKSFANPLLIDIV